MQILLHGDAVAKKMKNSFLHIKSKTLIVFVPKNETLIV
jgi:hypothetical protein